MTAFHTKAPAPKAKTQASTNGKTGMTVTGPDYPKSDTLRQLQSKSDTSAKVQRLAALQRKSTQRLVPSSAPIQRVVDEELDATITAVGGYKSGDPFRQYTEAENESGAAVDWKAHVGLQKAGDRAQAFAEAGPVLRKLGLNHKFDVRKAEADAVLQKFITIYPPKEQSDWAGIIAALDAAISVPTSFDENTEKGVMGGKVAMRHGQISAISPQTILQAGIPITKKQSTETMDTYSVDDAKQVVEASLKDKLVYHHQHMACFFLTPRPYPAIIWEGVLRYDPRQEWNPFGAALPEGIGTVEELARWEARRKEYLASDLYADRVKDYNARGGIGGANAGAIPTFKPD